MDNKAVVGCLDLYSRYSLDSMDSVVDNKADSKDRVGMGNSKVEKHRKVMDLPLALLKMVRMDLQNVDLHGVV